MFVSTGGLLGNNMFAYCGNSPVVYSDYSGKFGEKSNFLESKLFDPQMIAGGGGGVITVSSIALYTATAAAASATAAFLSNVLYEAEGFIEDQFELIKQRMILSLAAIKTLKEYRSKTETHHIVAQTSPKAIPAMMVLYAVYDNGVFDDNNLVPLKTAVHRRLHTNSYYDFVNFVVVGAYVLAGDDPETQYAYVTSALDSIRNLLKTLNDISPS